MCYLYDVLCTDRVFFFFFRERRDERFLPRVGGWGSCLRAGFCLCWLEVLLFYGVPRGGRAGGGGVC